VRGPSQVSNHPQPVQADSPPNPSSTQSAQPQRCKHLPSRHPVAPQVPNSTAKQQTQMGPQRPPGIPTPRVPDSVVPSQQNPGIQRQLHPCHHLAPQRPQPGHRWLHHKAAHEGMRQGFQLGNTAAEQQTVSCSSCMLPTVHQGATTARHRSDPCSSRHPKCRVNIVSNLPSGHCQCQRLISRMPCWVLDGPLQHYTTQEGIRRIRKACGMLPPLRSSGRSPLPDLSPSQRSALQRQHPPACGSQTYPGPAATRSCP